MRLRTLLLLFLLLLATPIANADITYNLLFADEYPDVGLPTIVGSLTLNIPPPASGVADYLVGTGASSYRIDGIHVGDLPYGDEFDLADVFLYPPTPTFDAVFVGGKLVAINGELSHLYSRLEFGSQAFMGATPLTVTYFDFTGTPSTALVSVTPEASPATPTPEPSTLALLGTGLLSAVSLFKDRLRW